MISTLYDMNVFELFLLVFRILFWVKVQPKTYFHLVYLWVTFDGFNPKWALERSQFGALEGVLQCAKVTSNPPAISTIVCHFPLDILKWIPCFLWENCINLNITFVCWWWLLSRKNLPCHCHLGRMFQMSDSTTTLRVEGWTSNIVGLLYAYSPKNKPGNWTCSPWKRKTNIHVCFPVLRFLGCAYGWQLKNRWLIFKMV